MTASYDLAVAVCEHTVRQKIPWLEVREIDCMLDARTFTNHLYVCGSCPVGEEEFSATVSLVFDPAGAATT